MMQAPFLILEEILFRVDCWFDPPPPPAFQHPDHPPSQYPHFRQRCTANLSGLVSPDDKTCSSSSGTENVSHGTKLRVAIHLRLVGWGQKAPFPQRREGGRAVWRQSGRRQEVGRQKNWHAAQPVHLVGGKRPPFHRGGRGEGGMEAVWKEAGGEHLDRR